MKVLPIRQINLPPFTAAGNEVFFRRRNDDLMLRFESISQDKGEWKPLEIEAMK